MNPWMWSLIGAAAVAIGVPAVIVWKDIIDFLDNRPNPTTTK